MVVGIATQSCDEGAIHSLNKAIAGGMVRRGPGLASGQQRAQLSK